MILGGSAVFRRKVERFNVKLSSVSFQSVLAS
jgi:hypothetical protein